MRIAVNHLSRSSAVVVLLAETKKELMLLGAIAGTGCPTGRLLFDINLRLRHLLVRTYRETPLMSDPPTNS